MFDPILSRPELFIGLAAILAFLIFAAIRDAQDRLRLDSEEPGFRLTVYAQTMRMLWGLAALCLVSWMLAGLSFSELGIRMPVEGWCSWLSWGLATLGLAYLIWSLIQTALSREARASIRRQIDGAGKTDLILPTNPAEHRRFQGLSVTAGITEELVFRGFLIGALALTFPVWLAACIATGLFILAHIYQGPAGMLKITPVSILLAAMFVIGESLWPVMLLHVFVDAIGGGMMAVVQHYEAEDQAASGEPQDGLPA